MSATGVLQRKAWFAPKWDHEKKSPRRHWESNRGPDTHVIDVGRRLRLSVASPSKARLAWKWDQQRKAPGPCSVAGGFFEPKSQEIEPGILRYSEECMLLIDPVPKNWRGQYKSPGAASMGAQMQPPGAALVHSHEPAVSSEYQCQATWS
jgi:hypothetical protein